MGKQDQKDDQEQPKKDKYTTEHSGEQRNPVIQKLKQTEQTTKAEKEPENVSPVSDPKSPASEQKSQEGKDVGKWKMTHGRVGTEHAENQGKAFDDKSHGNKLERDDSQLEEPLPEAEASEEDLQQTVPQDQYGNYDPDKAAPGENAPNPPSFGPGADAGVAKHGKQPG